MKKFILFALGLVLSLGVKAQLKQGVCGSGLNWEFDAASGTLSITGTGNYIESIDEGSAPWQAFRSQIEVVKISDNVKFIGARAFKSLPKLREVHFPKSLSNLGDAAFEQCPHLVTVELPEGLRRLSNGTFRSCVNLKTVVFPKTLTELGTEAFRGCGSIEKIELPKGLMVVNDGCFMECKHLEDLKLPTTVQRIGSEAFRGCSSLNTVVLPDGLKTLDDQAFEYCYHLTSVNVPRTVLNMGYRVFGNCDGLVDVKLQKGLGILSSSMFAECKNLSTVKIPESVMAVGENPFLGTAVMNNSWSAGGCYVDGCLIAVKWEQEKPFVIQSGTRLIAQNAFAKCKATSIKIPASLEAITEGAFMDCDHLKTITCEKGNNDYVVKDNILYNKEKTLLLLYPTAAKGGELEILESVNRIARGAFYGCEKITAIVSMPDNLTEIGDEAFRGCKQMTSCKLGKTVETLGDRVFWGCSSLSSLTLPANLGKIGSGCFVQCPKLSKVTPNKNSKNFSLIGQVLFDYKKTRLIVCPAKYKVSTVSVPASVITIDHYAFEGTPLVKTVSLGADMPRLTGKPVGLDTKVISVPKDALDAYKANQFWGKLKLSGR